MHRPPVTLSPEALEALFGEPVDCVVSGHTHRAQVLTRGNIISVNPGSPTDPRDGRRTVAVLDISEHVVAQVITLGYVPTGD